MIFFITTFYSGFLGLGGLVFLTIFAFSKRPILKTVGLTTLVFIPNGFSILMS